MSTSVAGRDVIGRESVPPAEAIGHGDARRAEIDVDTYRGTRRRAGHARGPRRAKVRASFYFTLGPDRSGWRPGVFRKPVPEEDAADQRAKMYGFRTMLYGTLLPAPLIGARCTAEVKACLDAGHEVGLHAWTTSRGRTGSTGCAREVRTTSGAAWRVRADLRDARPRLAAPAWFLDRRRVRGARRLGFDYISVSRGPQAPFVRSCAGAARDDRGPDDAPDARRDARRRRDDAENFNERLLARYDPRRPRC